VTDLGPTASADDRPVVGVYDLPKHVFVRPDVLGSRAATAAGPLRFDVLAPAQASDAAADVVVPPPLPLVADDDEALAASPWVMNYGAFTDGPAVALCRVGIVAPLENAERLRAAPWNEGSRRAVVHDALAHGVEAWFDAVRSWIEVLTGQDLDHRHPVHDATLHGHGLTLWDGGALSPPGLLTLTTPTVNPLDLSGWRSVLARVAGGAAPPAEHLLARDARAAAVRRETRKAVLDAAAAAELVLNGLLAQELARLPDATRSAVQAEHRTLGRLVDLLAKARPDVAERHDDLKHLTALRNRAAHRGAAPDYSDAVRAVDTAIGLVLRHVPVGGVAAGA
jgi:hypothetical protein